MLENFKKRGQEQGSVAEMQQKYWRAAPFFQHPSLAWPLAAPREPYCRRSNSLRAVHAAFGLKVYFCSDFKPHWQLPQRRGAAAE